MSLAHAILGILNTMPMTGYDLKHLAFDESIAYFWQADQAQIYRTLDRMAAAGWVKSVLEVQTERPNRKVYHITEAGQQELARWLATDQPLVTYREPFLIQLFFGAVLSNADLLRLIEGRAARHAERLAALERVPLPPLDDPTADRETVLRRLTLELGMALERTYLDWLDLCRRTVAELPPAEDGAHPCCFSADQPSGEGE